MHACAIPTLRAYCHFDIIRIPSCCCGVHTDSLKVFKNQEEAGLSKEGLIKGD